MNLSRRDFIRSLKDIGIGIGIVALVPDVVSPSPPESIVGELCETELPNVEGLVEDALRDMLYSANGPASASTMPFPWWA